MSAILIWGLMSSISVQMEALSSRSEKDDNKEDEENIQNNSILQTEKAV